jgi:hypothetical protein
MRALRTWNNDCYRLLLVLRGSGNGALDGDLPSDVVADIRRIIDESSTVPSALRDRLMSDGLDGLTEAERDSLAIGLMLSRNKVTHIYELVKAVGSARQIEYDRATRVWRRREAIARKHEHETSVDPFSGTIVRGVEHAPLLYANDPRVDLPTDLQARVDEVIRERDATVVAGWLTAPGR